MESKETTTLTADLTTRLRQYRPQRGRYYKSVTALMLLWQDDDLGCLAEVQQFSAILRTDFGYRVQLFFIPTDRPQDSLNRAVSDFLYSYGAFGNLILIYYAGHGDPDLGGERQAVWAAQKAGGPTVRWHLIQPIVEDAESDVLILLDCCFAGQVVRSRASHKVEILAAAAMGLRTPGVGQVYPSFTQALMMEMRQNLREHGSFEITTLYKRLLRKESNLQQQPFYAPIAGESITLRKLVLFNDLFAHLQGDQSPSFRMDVSLFEEPSGIQKERIMQWLTISSPRIVSTIEIHEAYTKARSVLHVGQRLCEQKLEDDHVDATCIPLAAKARLVHHFEDLISAVDRPIPPMGPDEAYVVEVTKNLKRNSQAFLETIEDCIANTSPRQLRDLAAIEETRMSGLANRVSMRLELLKELVPKAESFEETKVRFKDSAKDGERLRRGTIEEVEVIVEYYYQVPDSAQTGIATKEIPAAAIMQAEKVATLHAEPKDEIFCTLAGKGIVREHLHRPRLGFIYAIPEQYSTSSHLILAECYRESPNVPLELRVELAYKVTAAVVSLHSIGWLHKNIKSENVLTFFRSSGDKDENSSDNKPKDMVDLSKPFLLGFDCSRPTAAESLMHASWDLKSNLYLHPDRWGRPMKFRREHDIYAMGILLLEIAFWRPIYALDPERKAFSHVNDPEILRDIFIRLCDKKLAHTVGSRYASAVKTCLSRGIRDKKDDWQFQRYVRDQVMSNLRLD